MALLAAVIVVGGLAVTLPRALASGPSCIVSYKVGEQWLGGFQGEVTVKNIGDPLDSWTLAFDFPDGGQKVTQGWGGTWHQSGTRVTAASGALATDASATLGFSGTWASGNPVPAAFTLNGRDCTAGIVPPAVNASTSPHPSTAVPAPAPALKVVGNKIVTGSGAVHQLYGVNRSGGEFACIQGNGIWEGPMDQASITAMRAWRIRAVRVPLNEECWLGTPSVPEVGGDPYRDAVKDYVNLLVKNGITPILELHWSYGEYTGDSSPCADVKATCQKPMPDAQYAPTFWTDVATTFRGNDAVILDLFNEPFPDRAAGNTTAAWKCWRDGGTCEGIGYPVAGFQTLVDAVRATGATNIIMLSGLSYANDLGQWLTYKPNDPLNNLAAAAHLYNFNDCDRAKCWNRQLAPVAAQVPLTLSEIGENDCGHKFVDGLMDWADAHEVGYLGWTWNPWDCAAGPALISDHTGTPTDFGQGLKDRFARVAN
ncbi:cellulase family glycosylhydrolase [Actinoplanes sp. L3-i22]|uniref:cellulase family glycosylhydrolase n=1 Tax=Actinoplanes sp. L3-i22 TaxID=2836373 RepID=UPI001C855F1E|nr:cellulase family glycosylhydrolase [Actinoplanes sp. L3-i22]